MPMPQYLSAERLAELKQELSNLKTRKRVEIAERLRIAKDYGDLAENAEYAEAREEQAKIEGRIAELEDVVKNAITTRKECGDAVRLGCVVTVKKNGSILQYSLVDTYEAKPEEGKISDASPLGKAFMNKKIGETVSVSAPAGPITYEILKIE